MGHSIDMFLSRLQGDDHQQARDPGGPRGEQLRALRLRLRHEFTMLKEQRAKNHADPSKSEVGKRQADREAAKKVSLAFLDALSREAKSDCSRYATLLFTLPKSERSETLAFLSEQEIRRRYEDQPPQTRMEAYRTAMAHGQYEIARALTSGPLGSVVDAEFQSRVDQDHARRTQPAVYENYTNAMTMREHLDSLHSHAQQVLTALTDEAPVRAVA